MDGWSPEFPVLDDRDHPSSSVDTKRTHAEEIRAAQQDVCILSVTAGFLFSEPWSIKITFPCLLRLITEGTMNLIMAVITLTMI